MHRIERYLFGLGVAVILLVAGIWIGKNQYWPYDPLNDANDALRALWDGYFPEERPRFNSPRREGGVVRWERGATYDGYTFALTGDGEVAGAVLLDMDGRELHRWRLTYSEVFKDARHIISRSSDLLVVGRGAHLYPNGDVLMSFHGGNFPYGSGLAKVDKDSRVIWRLDRNTHHDLDVQPDGRIVVLGQQYLDQGEPSCAAFFKPPYLVDEILTVSADGELVDNFSLAEALCQSPYRSMLMPQGAFPTVPTIRPDVDDPQHTNNVDVLRPEQVSAFPGAKAGDYLVSFRNLNMIAIVDQHTKKVSWAMSGPFVRQHDPDLLPNGHILLYDNLGGARTRVSPEMGRSRVIELDPVSQQVQWSYAGGTAPEDRFDTPVFGQQEKLPNGNVLISIEGQGRAVEVTGDANPRVVWEYVNLIDREGDQAIAGPLAGAERIDPATLTFVTPTS